MSNRTEVAVLVAHLVLSLAVLLLYGISVYQGHSDDTLKNILLLVFGFWFGAVGGSKMVAGATKKTPQDPPKPDPTNNGGSNQ